MMDAVKFLEVWKRMCNSYESDCQECPSYKLCHAITPFGEMDNLQELVAYVEKWSTEHPVKTRLQDFLEKFPNASLNSCGLPFCLPVPFGYCGRETCQGCDHWGSSDCWTLPAEG